MKRIGMAILLTVWSAALAACGGGNSASSSSSSSAGGAACPAGSGSSGNGASVSIGSKGFAEEQLLATMTQLVLQAHGFNVTYNLQAKDTAIGDALVKGQIDMLWQYTGTELTDPGYLNLTNIPTDLNAAFQLVQQKDQARGLCWTSPAPMDDTNGLAIKASDKATLGSTLSDFATYLSSHPNTKICILSEFRTRPDGLPGLKAKYGAAYGSADYVDVGNTAEKNIANGDCQAGEVFTTDSPIAAQNLYVLQDDKQLFPPDNVGLVVRQSVLQKYPAIAALMAPVAAKITSAVITGLNKQVEIDNMKVTDVARAWLTQNGFLS
ncbi:MAG TPA: glycine betaine ABC transporter substrate-binding protein [Candidatus Dormibacteraeota bacterium]|nr:glycine betaine ABC transporter substrate-binding protein [Candidatus Dormibacteraeota bacterium]